MVPAFAGMKDREGIGDLRLLVAPPRGANPRIALDDRRGSARCASRMAPRADAATKTRLRESRTLPRRQAISPPATRPDENARCSSAGVLPAVPGGSMAAWWHEVIAIRASSACAPRHATSRRARGRDDDLAAKPGTRARRLSWADCAATSTRRNRARVVLHEIAHKLDGLDGRHRWRPTVPATSARLGGISRRRSMPCAGGRAGVTRHRRVRRGRRRILRGVQRVRVTRRVCARRCRRWRGDWRSYTAA